MSNFSDRPAGHRAEFVAWIVVLLSNTELYQRAFQPLAEQERLGHDVDAVHILPPTPALPRMAVLLRGSVVDTYAW